MDKGQSLKEWGLTEEAFNGLLNSLSPDREQAAEMYEEIRRKLVIFFEFRGCPYPQEQTDITINRVARRIHEGEKIQAADIASYFYGVARNVLREYWKGAEREAARLEQLPHINPFAEAPDELNAQEVKRLKRERCLECLEDCLRALPEETRQLILRYYQGEKGAQVKIRQALTEQLKISPIALRLRISRIRAKLDGCLKRCLEQ